MKTLLIFLTVCFLFGCATIDPPVETTITDPQGKVWTVNSKSDALVTAKKPSGEEITVDNRGKPGFWEGLLQYLLAKPDIKIEK